MLIYCFGKVNQLTINSPLNSMIAIAVAVLVPLHHQNVQNDELRVIGSLAISILCRFNDFERWCYNTMVINFTKHCIQYMMFKMFLNQNYLVIVFGAQSHFILESVPPVLSVLISDKVLSCGLSVKGINVTACFD